MNFNSHLHSNIHSHHQLKKFKEGIYSLYLVHSIRGFVASLIGFFIPIYLLKIGFSLIQVLSFYGIKSFFMILFVILSGGIGNKLGLKHTMAISLPLLLLYFVIMLFLENSPSLLVLYSLSILKAFSASLYWIPMHSLFARFSSDKKDSSQVGILLSLKSFSSIIAPLLGGLITIFFGFESLFIIAIIILIIPIVILANAKDIRPHINFSFNDFSIFFKEHRSHFMSIIIDSFGSFAENILWPLFIFLILINPMSVGIAGSLVGAGTILFTILLSKVVAKYNRLLIVKISAFMLGIIWIIRYFTSDQVSIYFISLLGGLAAIMISIPLTSHTYRIAKKSKDLDEFIVFRTIITQASQAVAVMVSIFLISNLNLSFLVTGVGYLFIILL